MLGAFSAICALVPRDALIAKLLSSVNQKYHEADLKAFERGIQIIRENAALSA